MAENDNEVTEPQANEPKLNTDYYDEVPEGEHAASAENSSVPDPSARELWQSTTITTDGSGPGVEDVAPVFAQARADALANPVLPDGEVDEDVASQNADSAQAAQERADAIRASDGYVAPTGSEAGQFDDASLEAVVPGENFNPAPEPDAEDRTTDAKAEEQDRLNAAEVNVVDTTEVDQQAPDKGSENANVALANDEKANNAENAGTEDNAAK